MSMISVAIKRPGEPPRHVNISDRLESLQKNVEGFIEIVRITGTDLVIVCNEEGLINGMPYNCNICGVDLHGPIIICGERLGPDGGELCDLPCDWQTLKAFLPDLWRAIN